MRPKSFYFGSTLIILTIINLINTLEIIQLKNPFLPIKLGTAKIIYSEHLFLHYFEFSSLELEIYKIYNNIVLLKNTYKQLKSNNSAAGVVLSSLSISDLNHAYHLLLDRYKNIKPANHNRKKRGLIDPIGSLYNAAFGLLDAEDGRRLEDAITKLSTNQKNLFNDLNHQMSLSSKIIDRFNNSLSIISDNQRVIKNHINNLQTCYDTFVVTSLKMLTLQEIKRQLITNCITLTEQLEEIENAIMFAQLHTIHPSVIHLEEIESMVITLQEHYKSQNIISLQSSLSYYKLLKAQVYFATNKIIFVIHFPVINRQSYDMFQIIPIPQNQVLIYPTTFFALQSPEATLMIEQRCQEIESTSYCDNTNHLADACMKSTLRQETPTDCSRHQVNLRTTLTQLIDNNLIIVPKLNEIARIKCNNQEQMIQVENPILIKMVPDCSVEVSNRNFDVTKQTYKSIPVILPEIHLEEVPETKHKAIEIKDPELDKITDLKHLVKFPDPLIPINIKAHSYSVIIILLVILIAAATAFIIYRWIGCSMLKRKTRLVQVAANLVQPTPVTTQPIELQSLQPRAKPRVENNTVYPKL